MAAEMEKNDEVMQLETANAQNGDVGTPESKRSSLESVRKEAVGGNSVSDLPNNYYRSYQYMASFVSFALSYQSAFLGYVMPATALTIINADIGPSADVIWVLLVFVLCQTIAFLIIGRLSDIFGRRWYFIGGNILSLVGWLVCGRAHNVDMLIGGSVISGFGTGIQQSMPAITGELIPNKHRFLSLALTFCLFAPLSTISPGLTRVFTNSASDGWRWIYYMVAIMSAVSAVLQLFFYHPPTFDLLHKRTSKMEALKGLDYGGLFIFIGSSTSLLLGISWGGQKYPWNAYQVITTIVVGGVGLIVFFIYEHFAHVKHPLVPLHLFKNRNFMALAIVSSVGVMTFFAVNVVWPQQIAILYNTSPGTTGWISSTVTAGAVFGQFCGSLVSFLPHTKWQLVIACVVFTTFIGGMAAVDQNTETMAIIFSLIASGMIGYMETLTIAGGPLTVESKDIGLACGVQYSLRSTLSVLALSVYVTIFENKATDGLVANVPPAAIGAGLPASSLPELFTALAAGTTSALLAVPGITPEILGAVSVAVQFSYNKAFQVVYLVSIAFGCCAIIASLLIDPSKMADKMTTDIARKLQGVGMKKEADIEKTLGE